MKRGITSAVLATLALACQPAARPVDLTAARAAWHNARHIPWPARRRRADPEPPITAAPGR